MIVHLELRHWCQHAHLDLDFAHGLNGLLGKNGKGKSNVLLALRFLDTGDAGPGELASNVTWGHEQAIVRGDYVVGSTHFSIRRTIAAKGKTTVQLKVQDGETFNKAGEVADFLDKIFAANKEARLNNVYIPQGELDAIIFAKPAQRADEFQKTFNLDNLKKAHDWLKIEVNSCPVTEGIEDMLAAAVSTFEAARDAGNQLASRRLTLQGQIDGLAGCEAILALAIEAARSKQAIVFAQGQVTHAMKSMAAAVKALEEALVMRNGTRVQVEQMRPAFEEVKKAIAATEAAVTAYQSGQTQRELLERHRKQLQVLEPRPTDEQLQAATVAADAAMAEVQRVEAIIANPPKMPREVAAEAERTEALRARQQLVDQAALPDQEIMAWEFELTAAAKHLSLVQQGKCPTCGSAFAHDPKQIQDSILDLQRKIAAKKDLREATYNAALGELASRFAEAEKTLKQCKEAATAAFASVRVTATTTLRTTRETLSQRQSARNSYDQIQGQISLLEANLARIPATQPDTSKLREQSDFVRNFQTMEGQLYLLESGYSSAQATYDGTKNAVAAAEANLANLGDAVNAPSQAAIDQAQGDAAKLTLARAEMGEVLQQIGINQGLVSTCQAEVTRLREKMTRETQLAKWVEQAKIARDALHTTALPNLAMREFGRVLNVRMEHYLTLWESSFRMWLDDEMAFQVEFDGGGRCEAKRLSGGQKIFASTSFRLAMFDTFASSVGMLILDEPAAYLDVDNVQHLQTLLLNLKATTSNRQILIVNHGDQLTGFLDHVIQI